MASDEQLKRAWQPERIFMLVSDIKAVRTCVDSAQIQTKFTPPSGQDPKNMPYSLSQSLEERIHTSIASSLKNFQTSSNPEDNYLDCLVLHSPLPSIGETQKAWQIFSTYVPHKIRALGISNTSFAILQSLYNDMTIKPSVVQNRFYADTEWEVPLRKFCREKEIVFQSFWTFTGNPKLMLTSTISELAEDLSKLGVNDPEVVALYALVIGLEGVTVLDGTTRQERMKADLVGLETVSKWAEGEGRERWQQQLNEFKQLIGEQS
jgi:diketogulonate reductase-like aldo/keto reductase